MDRRDFLKGAAALAAAPAVLAQKGPNDTIGVAIIGVGTRGYYLFQEFQKIQGVEIRSICEGEGLEMRTVHTPRGATLPRMDSRTQPSAFGEPTQAS